MGDVWLFYRAYAGEKDSDFEARIISAGKLVESTRSAGINVVFDRFPLPSLSAVVITAAEDLDAAQQTFISAAGTPFKCTVPDYIIRKDTDYFMRMHSILEELGRKEHEPQTAHTPNGAVYRALFSKN